MKNFYIETFGCQMNAHDSEKVVGTLLEKGYQQVAGRRTQSWCCTTLAAFAIRPNRKYFTVCSSSSGCRQEVQKTFGVLGCVAQQEGETDF